MYFAFIFENRRTKPVEIVLRRKKRGKDGADNSHYYDI
jgi:hypothetical protein